jgi:hypothetical protein
MAPPLQRIVWLYKRWQSLYDEINRTVVAPVEFENPRINDLFTEGSHHRNLSVVTLKQNLFFGKDPTQRRNCHHLVLFNNPVDRQPITTLGRQMYPGRAHDFLQKFEEVTKEPYSYLVVDLKPTTPDSLRLRTDILKTGIEKEKDEEEEEDVEGEEEDV